jgi:tRNA threonylcarbamoyladenosine biosynthesis protein TsaB
LKILAVDTSGREIGIGLFEGGKCLFEKYAVADRAYNRHIMQLVSEALKASGIKLEEIDVFAAVLGPGSFTGIRVGMSVMKAFAHSLNKKFFGASSLEILAEYAGAEKAWAVLEAGRNELYAAKSVKGKTGKFRLISREGFESALKGNWTVAGLSHENIMIELARKNSKIKLAGQSHISMSAFSALAARNSGKAARGVYETAPVYIRPSEAEAVMKRKKMQGVKKK